MMPERREKERFPPSLIPMKWRCLRCGYEWIPRADTPPETCANPKCRSQIWWIPKEEVPEPVAPPPEATPP